ncbi:hypothetical protein [Geothrix sp. 21YS21S-2]|uniref:hypothetical protein n=1 Tax=Geothrix sp. 21YS21S-2 TaxID=3068893 RepID=UPI0027B926F5|nr:hypothetical protein [Geothrix sp. 21YS21S-2]
MALLVASILIVGSCAPYADSRKHVWIQETSALTVTKRSGEAENRKGFAFAKGNLPIEAEFRGNGFKVVISTPVNPEPVVFLEVKTAHGEPGMLSGPHLIAVQPNFHFSFLVREAKGEPLAFSVFDSRGHMLGSATIRYRMRSRGLSYGIEAI